MSDPIAEEPHVIDDGELQLFNPVGDNDDSIRGFQILIGDTVLDIATELIANDDDRVAASATVCFKRSIDGEDRVIKSMRTLTVA